MFLKHTKWAMLWALLIFILCAIPGRDIPHVSFLELLEFDKLVHATLFFVLLLLLIRGFKVQSSFPKLSERSKIFCTTISIIYGGSLEIMQGAFFSKRSADVYDFIANSFGCIIGIIFYDSLERKFLVRLIK